MTHDWEGRADWRRSERARDEERRAVAHNIVQCRNTIRVRESNAASLSCVGHFLCVYVSSVDRIIHWANVNTIEGESFESNRPFNVNTCDWESDARGQRILKCLICAVDKRSAFFLHFTNLFQCFDIISSDDWIIILAITWNGIHNWNSIKCGRAERKELPWGGKN